MLNIWNKRTFMHVHVHYQKGNGVKTTQRFKLFWYLDHFEGILCRWHVLYNKEFIEWIPNCNLLKNVSELLINHNTLKHVWIVLMTVQIVYNFIFVNNTTTIFLSQELNLSFLKKIFMKHSLHSSIYHNFEMNMHK